MGWLFFLMALGAGCRDIATDAGNSAPEIHAGAFLLAFVGVSIVLLIVRDEINRRKPS